VICKNINSEERLPDHYWGINGFDFYWTVGSFGLGGDFYSTTPNLEISATISNLFFEHKNTKIGAEINIAKILFQAYGNELTGTPQTHFLNLKLYWNPFNFEKIILGPFAGINYITQNTNGDFEWNTATVSAGLKFLLRTREHDYWKFCFQIVGGEIGYRYDNGINCFYFTVTCDAIIPGIIALISMFGININN
jgi:hypothetical protein